MRTKACYKCNEEKLLEDFAKDPRTPDGRRGICKVCKNRENHESYLRHREKRIAYVQTWYQENKEHRLRYVRKWIAENKEKHDGYRIKRRRVIRDNVFEAYGNKCACCGEAEPMFLTIDHINGGGNKHRKEVLGSHLRAGFSTYEWLARNGFPKEFQCLCQNCNVGKHRNKGICPHKVRRRK